MIGDLTKTGRGYKIVSIYFVQRAAKLEVYFWADWPDIEICLLSFFIVERIQTTKFCLNVKGYCLPGKAFFWRPDNHYSIVLPALLVHLKKGQVTLVCVSKAVNHD